MPQPPVFFADRADLASDAVTLSGAEGRHAATVRRLRPGERVDVSDGAGLLAECVVTAAAPGGLELAVQARRQLPRAEPAITVVQAKQAIVAGQDWIGQRPHHAFGAGFEKRFQSSVNRMWHLGKSMCVRGE